MIPAGAVPAAEGADAGQRDGPCRREGTAALNSTGRSAGPVSERTAARAAHPQPGDRPL